MCGITGFIDFKGLTDQAVLHKMTGVINHRGPDDSGLEFLSGNNYQIGLGFKRLSIIDLSPLGHQPMFDERKETCIIFNGEIYNYAVIREELKKEGYSFKSNSDTEVILNAYKCWGKKCVDRFVGMFAICIYDTKERKVIFIRDRAGVKPLYWYWNNGLMLFSSELKTFHEHPGFQKSINLDALADFFMYGYINSPLCIFNYTQKLAPGHLLEVDLTSESFKLEKYWDVADYAGTNEGELDYEEVLQKTENLLQSACNYRMVADVPVGIFLSGGYDSSLVAAMCQKDSAKKIKTFTIGFNEADYNEAPFARKVAQHIGTEHIEYYCKYQDALDVIPLLPGIYDEPFGDSSAIPTYLVSKLARNEVTVALSADGGDELFGGYPRHQKALRYDRIFSGLPDLGWLSSLLQQLPKEKNIGKYDRIDKIAEILKDKGDIIWNYAVTSQAFTYNQADRLIKDRVNRVKTFYNDQHQHNMKADPLAKILLTDYKTYMSDDILVKVDRATMAVSLEGREPLIDHRLAEFIMGLPPEFKIHHGVSKRLLKDIVHKYIPKTIMDRPKMGFGIPVSSWLKHELKPLLLSVLDKQKIEKQGVLNARLVEEMVMAYLNEEKVDFQRIWFLLMFQMWYDKWMKS